MLIIIILSFSEVFAQANSSHFEIAFQKISEFIDRDQKQSFKFAVFLVENAYLDGNLPIKAFQEDIDQLSSVIKSINHQSLIEYSELDKQKIETYAAIFKVMTDTVISRAGQTVFINMPFMYDFEDVFGNEDWSQMFVSKLLATKKGNCHSLPYLYKILAEELGETAHLSLAPNHIYIKHYSRKTGWYNTELTSASFPIDAWLMASGYVHMDAIRNEVYMDTLSQKESLALNLLDLAQGYERKFGIQDGEFILKAADRALDVNPNFINALLLKAETQKKLFEDKMLMKSIDDPNTLMQQDEDARTLFLEMESLYVRIHQLGYRQMPEEMYLDWLTSLQEERDKYLNKSVPVD